MKQNSSFSAPEFKDSIFSLGGEGSGYGLYAFSTDKDAV
jgi:hypothetical protein